jgi:transposase
MPRKPSTKVHKSTLVIDIIKTSIMNDPFISIIKLQDIIKNTMSVSVSKELVRQAIKRQGWTKKKARYYGVSKALPEKTKCFLENRTKFVSQNRSFVSIDETSFGRNGINIKGYSPKGTKLFLQKAAPRMTTTSVVACVSNKSILATKVVKGAFNTQLFLDFLVNLNLPSQTVVLLDNVRFHHSRVVKDYAMSQGIDLLYVPPYSPWFNPVELCFSVVKRHYYKTLDIKTSFQMLTTQHCKSFFDRSLKITNGPC